MSSLVSPLPAEFNAMPIPSPAVGVRELTSTLSPHLSLSQLYCGAVSHIHSYLSFPELLRLSHYHRQVSSGVINPSGTCRAGQNVPRLVWDAIEIVREKRRSQHEISDTEAQQISLDQEQADSAEEIKIVQSVWEIADAAITACEASDLPPYQMRLSDSEVEQFLAMVPAPSYGAPPRARRCVLHTMNDDFKDLMLSPIIGRHAQEVVVDYLLPQLDVALLAIRFPFLHSLSLKSADRYQEPNEKVLQRWRHLSSAEARFPSQLRRLIFTEADYVSSPTLCDLIVPPLVKQCPMLEDLRFAFRINADNDLAPLLSLPHLTNLSLTQFADERTPRTVPFNNVRVIQQLSQLKAWNLSNNWLTRGGNWDIRFLQYLPISMSLESVADSQLTVAKLKLLAERTPNLQTLGRGTPSEPLFWATDFEPLTKFQQLRTLHFGQFLFQVRRRSGRLQGEDLYTTDLVQRVIAQHGSLRAFQHHTVSSIGRMCSLTSLLLSRVYTTLESRSVMANGEYFSSRGMRYDRWSSLRWDDHVQHIPGFSVAIQMSSFEANDNRAVSDSEFSLPSASLSSHSLYPYDPTVSAFQQNIVFQLASRLPQLLNLSIEKSSALHLPSLALLQHLPHLHTLSLSKAYFLPVESLHDLRHVSATLTNLTIRDSFPTDSTGRAVYLLHDLLQPLQFSYPVSKAVTIKIPTCWQPFCSPETVINPSEDVTAKFIPGNQTVYGTGSSISVESALSSQAQIPPRHSSWLEVCVPKDFRKGFLQYFQDECDATVTQKTLLSHPYFDAVLSEWHEIKKIEYEQNPHRLVFDSFTSQELFTRHDLAHVKPSSIVSRLLPKLSYCEIEHAEPNGELCFVYDRCNLVRCPSGALHLFTKGADPDWIDKIEYQRKRMLQVCGLNRFCGEEEVHEIGGMHYEHFLDYESTHQWRDKEYDRVQGKTAMD